MHTSEDELARVREGMRVVDVSGDEIGRVQYVQLGDPQAATTEGNEDQPPELLGRIAQAALPDEREPDVPEPLRSNLRRTGYIKIDGPDLKDTDRYASTTHVREVSGETVRLDVPRSKLATEE